MLGSMASTLILPALASVHQSLDRGPGLNTERLDRYAGVALREPGRDAAVEIHVEGRPDDDLALALSGRVDRLLRVLGTGGVASGDDHERRRQGRQGDRAHRSHDCSL